MDNSQLEQFIQNQRLAGIPDETTRTQLIQAGWPAERLQALLPPVLNEQPIRPKPKKKSLLPVLIVSIALLVLAVGATTIFLINKKPKPQTFAALTQVSFSDITFSQPSDWQKQTSEDRTTQIYSKLAEGGDHGVASISVTAGYDAIGEGFPDFPASLQQSLLEKIRQNAKVENFIEFTPFKDCQDSKFTSLQDVTYPETFLALKSTGTCNLDGHEKTMVAVLIVLRKSGITAGMVAGADTIDFQHNSAKFEEIINSIRAK